MSHSTTTSTGIALSQVGDDFSNLFTLSIRGRTVISSRTNHDDPLDPWTNSIALLPLEPRQVPSCYVPSPTPRRPPRKRNIKNKHLVALHILPPIPEQDRPSA